MAQLGFWNLFTTGMAIFAMFFGAGNIIFPLALGYHSLEQTPFALAGLLLTAVFVPLCGLLTMFFFQGRVKEFFGRIGKFPGLIIGFFVISLLGPLGSTPRCIALALSTLQLTYPNISVILFNFIACSCLFFMVYKKKNLLGILGYFLTPALIGLLVFIIFKGFWTLPEFIPQSEIQSTTAFFSGLKEGYNTMDLLAAFFFAPVIISLTHEKTKNLSNLKSRLYFVVIASLIGAALLSAVYIGFSFLAAKYASILHGVSPQDLLGTIALTILGPEAGLVVNLTVVLACLTTAVALITAFTDFVHEEILRRKISYTLTLGGALLLTFLTAYFEFSGISQFLSPVLEMIYPFLILLTLFNFVERLYYLKGIPSYQDEALDSFQENQEGLEIL